MPRTTKAVLEEQLSKWRAAVGRPGMPRGQRDRLLLRIAHGQAAIKALVADQTARKISRKNKKMEKSKSL